MRGELATVLRWLKALPEEVLRVRQKLGLNYAFMLTMSDDSVGAEERLLEVEQTLRDEGLVGDGVDRKALLGQAAAIRATLLLLGGYDGDMTIAAGNDALSQLPDTDLYWRAWASATIGVAHFTSNGVMGEAERCLKGSHPTEWKDKRRPDHDGWSVPVGKAVYGLGTSATVRRDV